MIFAFVLLVLAAYRLVRVVQVDQFPVWAGVRARILDRADAGGNRVLADLLSCPWCLGVWAAALLLAVALNTPAWFGAGLVVVLAASTVIGLLADWRDR